MSTGADTIGATGSLLQVVPRLARPTRGGSRPDALVDVAQAGPLRVAAVSLRGLAHFDPPHLPRQDAYAIGQAGEGRWLIGVIADGVSAGHNSHLAADIACQTALSQVRTMLSDRDMSVPAVPTSAWEELARTITAEILLRARPIYQGKIRTADGADLDPLQVPTVEYARRMATTAELVVVDTEPDPAGGHAFVRVVVAGDGSGLVLDPRRGWRLLGRPTKQTSEGLVSHAVADALPSDEVSVLVRHDSIEPGQALVITTDGIGDFLADGSTPVGGYLHQAWRTPVSHAEMLRSASFVTFQCDDDRTAVVVWA
jgi:serine/threonine protein phosphatase PrpC